MFCTFPNPCNCSPSHFLSYQIYKKISIAADVTVAGYREATPAIERNALEVWKVMLKAEQKMVKAKLAKNFEKYISVANMNNEDGFFDEVCLLFPLF